MAQWKKLQSLANSNHEIGKRLVEIYQRKFPIEVRGQLADTVEVIDWFAMDTNDHQNLLTAGALHFQSLVSAIDTRIQGLQVHSNDFTSRVQLLQAKENILEQFQGNVGHFVITMQQCMREEKLLIESCESEDDDRRPVKERASENPELMAKIIQYKRELDTAENDLTYFGTHQANFRIEYTSYSENIEQIREQLPNGIDREKEAKQLEQERNQKAKLNFNMRTKVGRKHQQLQESLDVLIQDVWKEIYQWRNELKLSSIGLTKTKDGQIDILDSVCFKVNEFLLRLLNQVDKTLIFFNDLKYESPDSPDEWIPKMLMVANRLNTMLDEHLKKIFVVDKCPRILKVITGKSLGFTMSCRLLGAYAFNLQSPPKVTAELHREQDIKRALQERKKGMCDIANGRERQMDHHRSSGQYIGNFNSVQLQKVKQLDKSSDKLVMENRFGMIFYTDIKIRDRPYFLKALSPPMALISHVLQDCMARAFLIWDAAFSKPDEERVPFEHPQEVSWCKVAQVLDALFNENTGRGLDQDQLHYLGRVAFKEKGHCQGDLSQRKIGKSQLIKERMHKDFSFWKWFYANMNLIKERLTDEWRQGLIKGFISKEEIMEKLDVCDAGTFMLRFSERSIENSSRADICGHLTLAVIEIDPATERKKVYHVKEHLTPKDIFERGLGVTLEAFEVKDYKTKSKRPLLKYLYPDLPFETTFEKYLVKTPKKDNDDYKSGRLRIEIFLTEENDGLLPRNKKITLPMSPISSVASPANSDMTHMTSPPYSDDQEESRGPFSPESLCGGNTGPKAIALVSPQVYPPTATPADLEVTSLSLNPGVNNNLTELGHGRHIQFATENEEPNTTMQLPPGLQMENLLTEQNIADAAANLMDLDSGELSNINSGTSAGSGVVEDPDGDFMLSEDVMQQYLQQNSN